MLLNRAGRLGEILVGAREIAAAGAHLVALVIGRLDFNFVITPIEGMVRGVVRDGVLVAQFVADVLKRLVEIVHVIRIEGAAAGFLGEGLQDFIAVGEMVFVVAGAFLFGVVERNPLRAGADGVDDHAGALGHFDGFGAGVLREIVFAIADQNHHAADDVGLVARGPRRVAELLYTS